MKYFAVAAMILGVGLLTSDERHYCGFASLAVGIVWYAESWRKQ